MTNNSISDLKQSTYFIIAGEESADNHGATLMKAMLSQNPNAKFSGIGGNKMISVGLNSIENIEKLAVMGFVEIIRHLIFFHNLAKRILHEIDVYKPRKIILIDYPGFNLRLAKKIKKQVPSIKIKIMLNKKDPDKRDYFVSNNKIEKKGFRAKISLDKGIKQLIIFFKNNQKKIINNY